MYKLLFHLTTLVIYLASRDTEVNSGVTLPILFTSLWAYKKLETGTYKGKEYYSGLYTERYDIIVKENKYFVSIKQHTTLTYSNLDENKEQHLIADEQIYTYEMPLTDCEFKEVDMGEGFVGGGKKTFSCPFDKGILSSLPDCDKEITLTFGFGAFMKLYNPYCSYLDYCLILSRNNLGDLS